MMKRVIRHLAGAVLACAAIFAHGAELPASFDLQGQPLNVVVPLYYKEIAKRPYAMCDQLLNDSRLVSIRAAGKTLDSAMTAQLLDAYGYEAREEKGLVIVCTKPKETEAQDYEPMLYRVRHRDASYLVDLLSPLVRGTFANRRSTGGTLAVGGAQASPSGASSMASMAQASGGVVPVAPTAASPMKSGTGDDYIIFNGPEKERAKLSKLLAQLDVPTGEVVIKGYVYEVGTNNSEGSAIDLLASLLKGKLEININTGAALANSIRVKSGGIDAVASALSTDGRFKIVTSPYTRVASGGTARFQVGADVPVLGSIVTNASGQAQQSVEYRSAGTVLEVTPQVRDQVTVVDLFEQISSFVATETGVNNSPTLNKRELRTRLSVADGDILVVGGLNDSKEDESRTGLWFLPFATSKSGTKRNSELLLILELKRI